MAEAYIIDAVRTPTGKRGGGLSQVHPADLGAAAIRALLDRTGVDPMAHETTLGTTVANLGFGEITFPAPVFHGDTLRVETEVLEARASNSRPGQGVVTFEHRGFNQEGQLVCRAVRNALMLERPTG